MKNNVHLKQNSAVKRQNSLYCYVSRVK